LIGHDKLNLESRLKEYGDTVHEKARPWRVMVALKLYNVFISCIFVMKFICVMLLYKVILNTSCKQGWNKTFSDMIYGL